MKLNSINFAKSGDKKFYYVTVTSGMVVYLQIPKLSNRKKIRFLFIIINILGMNFYLNHLKLPFQRLVREIAKQFKPELVPPLKSC